MKHYSKHNFFVLQKKVSQKCNFSSFTHPFQICMNDCMASKKVMLWTKLFFHAMKVDSGQWLSTLKRPKMAQKHYVLCTFSECWSLSFVWGTDSNLRHGAPSLKSVNNEYASICWRFSINNYLHFSLYVHIQSAIVWLQKTWNILHESYPFYAIFMVLVLLVHVVPSVARQLLYTLPFKRWSPKGITVK